MALIKKKKKFKIENKIKLNNLYKTKKNHHGNLKPPLKAFQPGQTDRLFLRISDELSYAIAGHEWPAPRPGKIARKLSITTRQFKKWAPGTNCCQRSSLGVLNSRLTTPLAGLFFFPSPSL